MSDKFKNAKGKIIEYIKFNVIGISNFLVSQIFYISLYLIFHIHYLIAYTITSVLSITAAYFLNSKFTFKDNEYSPKKFTMTALVYIIEYTINFILIWIMVRFIGINEIVAPIIAPAFSTPPVFFMMRAVIKKNKK